MRAIHVQARPLAMKVEVGEHSVGGWVRQHQGMMRAHDGAAGPSAEEAKAGGWIQMAYLVRMKRGRSSDQPTSLGFG